MVGKLLSGLFGGGIGQVADGVSKVAGIFGVNREAEAQRRHRRHTDDADVLISAQRQFAREFHAPANWFDSLINGVNRIPRPAMALTCLAPIWLAYFDPIGLAQAVNALALIPLELWGIIGGVFAFYFGSRAVKENKQMRISAEAAKQFLERQAALEELRPARAEPASAGTAPAVLEVDGENEPAAAFDDNPPADRLRARLHD